MPRGWWLRATHLKQVDDHAAHAAPVAPVARLLPLVLTVVLGGAGAYAFADPPPPALDLLEYLGTLQHDDHGWYGPEDVTQKTEARADAPAKTTDPPEKPQDER